MPIQTKQHKGKMEIFINEDKKVLYLVPITATEGFKSDDGDNPKQIVAAEKRYLSSKNTYLWSTEEVDVDQILHSKFLAE